MLPGRVAVKFPCHFFKKSMASVISYLWQLPQNLVGLLVRLVCRIAYGAPVVENHRGVSFYYYKCADMGVSLGAQVIMSELCRESLTSKDHEYGHCLQSRRLGWLYLIVIGLPSLFGNIYDRIFHTESNGWDFWSSYKWYYNQPVERWADKLGGVHRFFIENK